MKGFRNLRIITSLLYLIMTDIICKLHLLYVHIYIYIYIYIYYYLCVELIRDGIMLCMFYVLKIYFMYQNENRLVILENQ